MEPARGGLGASDGKGGVKLNGFSICTGIGGLDLGIHLAARTLGIEYRTAVYLERETYCVEVLKRRIAEKALDDAPVWDDITTFDGKPWRGIVDLIHAGLPCQPYSVAGKRQGDKDERYIWDDFFRIVREVQPSLVFLENVSGLLAWFQPIGEELSAMGFCFEAGLFTAAEVGAPHKRERLFILAYCDDTRFQETRTKQSATGVERNIQAMADAESVIRQRTQRKRNRTGQPEVSAGNHNCTLGNPDLTGSQGRQSHGCGRHKLPAWPPGPTSPLWAGIIEERPDLAPAVAHANDPQQGTRDQATRGYSEWKQEQPYRFNRSDIPGREDRADAEGQAPQPAFRNLDDGLRDWMVRTNTNRVDQLRSLGNAVVPQCAAKAFIELWRKVT